MINVTAVLNESKEIYIRHLIEREGVSPESIVVLTHPSPSYAALCEAIVNAVNRELMKL